MRWRKKDEKFYYSRRGFTIIEVTVVIVIIGILTGLVAFLYTDYQKENRDTVRETDTEIIHNALERYYSDNGSYPSITSMIAERSASSGDCEFGTFSGDCNYEILDISEDAVVAPQAPSDTANSIVRPGDAPNSPPAEDVYIYEGLGGTECSDESRFAGISEKYASTETHLAVAPGVGWCEAYNLRYWSEVEEQWVEIESLNRPSS